MCALARRAKVDELGVAPVVEHDVLRLDVAVADVLGHWVIGPLGGWEMGAFEGLPLEAALRQMGQMVIGPSGHWDRG